MINDSYSEHIEYNLFLPMLVFCFANISDWFRFRKFSLILDYSDCNGKVDFTVLVPVVVTEIVEAIVQNWSRSQAETWRLCAPCQTA